MLWTVLALVFAPACGKPLPSEAEHVETQVEITAQMVGWSMGKPPLNALRMDLDLHNPSKDKRWYIVRRSFYIPEQAAPELNVYSLALHRLKNGSGKGSVIEISGGYTSFLAVQLPPTSKVTVKNLNIDAWGDLEPNDLHLSVVVASEILVDGKPIPKNLPADPICETNAWGTYDRHDSEMGLENKDSTVPLSFAAVKKERIKVSYTNIEEVMQQGGWD
ncbi:MAG: hypothetical protein HN348_19320 [Proteobacteria bacterium]|nr:hypothetical protein [Pseudomonadota bacterium]